MKQRGKFAWEREEAEFAEKRRRLAAAILDTRRGLLAMGIALAFLIVLFVLIPPLLFRGPLDYLVIAVLFIVYVAIALAGARVLRLRERGELATKWDRSGVAGRDDKAQGGATDGP